VIDTWLRDLITSLLVLGSAGLLVGPTIERIAFLRNLQDKLYKVLVAMALSTAYAGLLYGFAVIMLFLTAPADWRAAVSAVAFYGGVAFQVSQGIYRSIPRNREPDQRFHARVNIASVEMVPVPKDSVVADAVADEILRR
jgi:hypothetical protein